MKKLILIPTLFVVLSACGSDDGPTADVESDVTTAATTAEPDTTPAATASTEPAISADCDGAIGAAQDAVAGVMDTLDEAETMDDLEAVDPDEVGAAFELLGEAIGTGCTADELDNAVSRLITFAFDEGSARSEASAGFASGFVPELCGLAQELTPSAAEACDATANP